MKNKDPLEQFYNEYDWFYRKPKLKVHKIVKKEKGVKFLLKKIIKVITKA